MIFGSSKPLRLLEAEVSRSSLEPPSMFSSHGHDHATGKLFAGGPPHRYQIEDPEGLEVAIEALSGRLALGCH